MEIASAILIGANAAFLFLFVTVAVLAARKGKK